MALTIQQIYERYNQVDFVRVIEIKRRNTNDTYEGTWQNVETLSGLRLLKDSVQSINYSLSNDNYNYGIVNVNDALIKFNSLNGQFDDENNANSIFFGYIRHKSLIRIRDGYVDKYTDPDNPTDVLNTVFEGFIDDLSNSTIVSQNNFEQYLLAVDKLTFLLKEYTINDVRPLSSTTLSDLIYEILNRSEFTSFFTVSSGNIDPGYDATSFDESEYEGQTQLFSVFEEFSIGHSFFFLKDNVFYYKDITDAIDNTIVIDETKIIEFSNFGNGVKDTIERWNWENSSESYTAPTIIYNRGKTLNVSGVTNTTQRQNLLNYIGEKTRIKRKIFKLIIPYYPNIFILDKISIIPNELYQPGVFTWDISNWDEDVWGENISASNIITGSKYLVREVEHSNFKTILTLKEAL